MESYTVGPHTYHLRSLLHFKGSLVLVLQLYTNTFDLFVENERLDSKLLRTPKLRMIDS